MARPRSFCNPVLERSFTVRQNKAQSKKCLYWAIINFFLAFVVYSDLLLHKVGILGRFNSLLVQISECVLAAGLTLNILINVLKYIWPRFITKPVEVNRIEKQLLGVQDTDSSFKVYTRNVEDSNMSPNFSFNSGHMNNLSGDRSSSFMSNYSPCDQLHSNLAFRNLSYSPTLPQAYYSSSPNDTFSPDSSLYFRNKSLSPSSSPWSLAETSGLFKRKSTPYRLSPGEKINDEDSLTRYLDREEEKQYQSYLSSPDNMSNISSFWNYQCSPNDYSHVLRKYEYQLACRYPQTSTHDDRDDSPHSQSDIWSRLNVSENCHYLWLESLRKWLCATITSRVSKEINKVNKRLERIGCEDLQIGEVSTSTLKQLVYTKFLHVPSLNALIPYLDASSNHSYVVKRLHDLARGGCMSDYDWNSGGSYGKLWGENLPNDATLLAHQLCTYLDSRLPADAKFPDGKTFTSQFFVKTPDKPNLLKEDNLYLYQTKIHPPHFDVVIGKEIWAVPKGRNNFFDAVLIFLYHIKTKKHGMLGRVNLGPSGINMLHIIEAKNV